MHRPSGERSRAFPSGGGNGRATRSRLCRAPSSPRESVSRQSRSEVVGQWSVLEQDHSVHRVRHSPFLFLFYTRLSLVCPSFSISILFRYSLHLASSVSTYSFRRARSISRSGVSRSPGLSFREIHAHDNTHTEKECHSVELLTVGKEQKLAFIQATVPRDHHRQPPTPTSDSSASPSKYVAFCVQSVILYNFAHNVRNI